MSASSSLAEPPRRFSCAGKQVLRDRRYYADAADDAAAFHIAMALNTLERHLLEPST